MNLEEERGRRRLLAGKCVAQERNGSVKRVLRTVAGTVCRASWLLARAEVRMGETLTILCYHRVLPAEQKAGLFAPDLAVTPEVFRRHCCTLAKRFEVLPISEALAVWPRAEQRMRPLAAITFDDGYRDNFEFAAPILAETGLGATFYAIAGLVEAERPPWYDLMGQAVAVLLRAGRLNEILREYAVFDGSGEGTQPTPKRVVASAKGLLPEKRKALLDALCSAAEPDALATERDQIMTWRQLAGLAAAGHEIGSHTQTHEILPLLDDEMLDAELIESRRILEDGLGRPVHAFCYPNGDHDDRTVRAVERAGYTSAVTVAMGNNEPGQPLLRLKRWFIHEDKLAAPGNMASATLLRMELSGLSDRILQRRRRRGEQP